MLVRYHLFYYAIFALLVVVCRFVHPLFLIALAFYSLFLVRRTSFRHLLVAIVLSLPLLRMLNVPRLPHYLSGRVVTINTNHIIVKTTYGKVKVYTKDHFLYQDEIRFSARSIKIHEAANDNGFSEDHYLKGAHIIGKMYMTHLYKKQSHFSLANLLEEHFSHNVKLRSYQRLFILGLKDEEIKSDYSAMTSLSIVHMFALSGMHVMILYSLLFQLYGFAMPKKIAHILAEITIGLYVFMIPFNISLHRAFFVLVLGDIFKKHLNRLDILGLLIIGHLLYNPYVIYSISFVFSYFIYLIVILTKDLKGSPLLIYLSTIPIVLSLNFSVNLVSFLLADLLMPFVEGFYIITLGSLFFAIFKPVLSLMIYVFTNILKMTGDLSSAITFQKPTLLFMGLYYYAYFTLLYRREMHQPSKRTVLFLCALMISFHVYSKYKIYSEIGMINVGQGDCSYFRLPYNQGNYLIDTGGNIRYDVATTTVIPFLKSQGIDHLDGVYISHTDYDHSGALSSLKEHFKVKKVIMSPETEKTIGPMTIKFLKTGHHYGNKNDDCNIQYVTLHDYHYLFTGDLSEVGEKALLKKYHHLDVDVLKVGHHGSKHSSSVSLFEMIHPKIAFIGVGENNFYGHPSDIVIKRLQERNIYILRTDQDGNFCVRDYGYHHYVFKHHT